MRWFVDRDGFEHARELQRKLLDGAAAVETVDFETTADRLERAAHLSAQKNLGMYDALFIQLAAELDMPLLTTDVRLRHAASGSAPIELLQRIQKRDLA